MLIGYARATATPPTLADQKHQLKAAGCAKVFAESDWKSRDELAKALHGATFGDVLIVTSLDRAAWGVRELLALTEQLRAAGIGLRSLAEPWTDPATDPGRYFPDILKGLARFDETSWTVRMATTRKEAIANGVKLGRDAKLTDAEAMQIARLYDGGAKKIAALSSDFKVAESTIWRAIRRGRKLLAAADSHQSTQPDARSA